MKAKRFGKSAKTRLLAAGIAGCLGIASLIASAQDVPLPGEPAPSVKRIEPTPSDSQRSPDAAQRPKASETPPPFAPLPIDAEDGRTPVLPPAPEPRDPTVPGPMLREYLTRDREQPATKAAPTTPQVSLTGRIVHRDGSVVAMVSVNGKSHIVRQGSKIAAFQGAAKATLHATDVTTEEIRFEIQPTGEELLVR